MKYQVHVEPRHAVKSKSDVNNWGFGLNPYNRAHRVPAAGFFMRRVCVRVFVHLANGVWWVVAHA